MKHTDKLITVVVYTLQVSSLWEESLKAVASCLRQRVVSNDICFVFNVLGLQGETYFERGFKLINPKQ